MTVLAFRVIDEEKQIDDSQRYVWTNRHTYTHTLTYMFMYMHVCTHI